MTAPVRLGLRENLGQFSLLVAVNVFVGAMVGLARSTLPLVARVDFGVTSAAAVLSFIVGFGLAKAFTNLAAGALADRIGRRRLLIVGWLASKLLPGESSDFIIELPPIRMPRLDNIIFKTIARLEWAASLPPL